MSSAPAMTTTSYAILGLLAVRPWTTHELVQQVDRSLRRIWPRAQSKLYEEPKKLVAHGFATASDDSVGRRRRTRYTITAKGRRALAAWVAQPGEGPTLAFEQLVKIHFADSGTKADVIANLDAAIEKANALPDSYVGALQSNYSAVVETHAAITLFTDDLKSQFLTVLALDIPDDVAADND